MTLTDEQLRAGLALCSAATPGPWTRHDDGICAGDLYGEPADRDDIVVTDSGAYPPAENDEAFICSSRTLLPLALAEIVTLRARLVAVEAARDEACRLLDGCIVELAALEEDPSMLDGHRHIAAQCRNAGKETSR